MLRMLCRYLYLDVTNPADPSATAQKLEQLVQSGDFKTALDQTREFEGDCAPPVLCLAAREALFKSTGCRQPCARRGGLAQQRHA